MRKYRAREAEAHPDQDKRTRTSTRPPHPPSSSPCPYRMVLCTYPTRVSRSAPQTWNMAKSLEHCRRFVIPVTRAFYRPSSQRCRPQPECRRTMQEQPISHETLAVQTITHGRFPRSPSLAGFRQRPSLPAASTRLAQTPS